MAIPVIETASSNTSAADASSLVITTPTGVATGDLLLLLASNDYSLASNDIFNAITGWTKSAFGGDITTDAQLAVYWRIADGTEGASETITFSANTKSCGHYLRVSGANSTQLDNSGTVFLKTATTAAITTPGITTNSANTLVINFVATDGGDCFPFTASTAGWTKDYETQSETGGQGCAQTIVTQGFATAGATGDSLVSYTTSDQSVGVIFSIAEGASGSTTTQTGAITLDFTVTGRQGIVP